jgi:hypothetical protein
MSTEGQRQFVVERIVAYRYLRAATGSGQQRLAVVSSSSPSSSSDEEATLVDWRLNEHGHLTAEDGGTPGEYRVRWAGYRAADDTWEQAAAIEREVPQMVQAFVSRVRSAHNGRREARGVRPAQTKRIKSRCRKHVRAASHKQQHRQPKRKRQNLSRFLGVSWDASARIWVAKIKRSSGGCRTVGSFATEHAAACAYDDAVRQRRGAELLLTLQDPACLPAIRLNFPRVHRRRRSRKLSQLESALASLQSAEARALFALMQRHFPLTTPANIASIIRNGHALVITATSTSGEMQVVAGAVWSVGDAEGAQLPDEISVADTNSSPLMQHHQLQREGYLHFLASDCPGKGIGTALMYSVARILRCEGVRELALDAQAPDPGLTRSQGGNDPVRFYQACGCVRVQHCHEVSADTTDSSGACGETSAAHTIPMSGTVADILARCADKAERHQHTLVRLPRLPAAAPALAKFEAAQPSTPESLLSYNIQR